MFPKPRPYTSHVDAQAIVPQRELIDHLIKAKQGNTAADSPIAIDVWGLFQIILFQGIQITVFDYEWRLLFF